MQGWIKTGAISKAKLPKLWDYFADVVDWSHWGMDGAPGAAASPPALDALLDGLGTVLRRLPVSSRPAAAGILHSWAIEPERDDWRAMLHMIAASKQHSRAA